jgi:integrase
VFAGACPRLTPAVVICKPFESGRSRIRTWDLFLDLRGRRLETDQSAYVFRTSRGGRQSPDNFRFRVLRAAVTRANENLAADDLPPLPDRLTPHSLRRTFCSLLYALGEDPGVVMDEMGHTNPALALRVYRQAMRRGEDEKAQLAELVEGSQLAVIRRRDAETPSRATEREAGRYQPPSARVS